VTDRRARTILTRPADGRAIVIGGVFGLVPAHNASHGYPVLLQRSTRARLRAIAVAQPHHPGNG
jgi:hypothetical protein